MNTKILEERAELHTINELRDWLGVDLRNDFPYLKEEDWNEPRILRLELGNEITHFDAFDTMYTKDPNWDAYIGDTYFSRFVLKFLEDDDEGFVRVGFQMA